MDRMTAALILAESVDPITQRTTLGDEAIRALGFDPDHLEAEAKGDAVSDDNRIIINFELTAEEIHANLAKRRQPAPACDSCGYPEDSFACKIRHINLNSGDCKAAND